MTTEILHFMDVFRFRERSAGNTVRRLFGGVLLLCLWTPIISSAATSSPLFSSDEILNITLAYDIRAVENDRGDTRSVHNGVLSWRSPNSVEQSTSILLTVRGKTRRNPSLCDNPPLTVEFADPNASEPFRGPLRLKLVNQCQKNKDRYAQYLLLEYLCYRIFNTITDHSFRVRLLNLVIRDSRNPERSFPTFGFFIENKQQLAARLGGKPEDSDRRYWYLQDNREQAIMELFEFMIGNTDWSVAGRHNVELIQTPSGVYAVPYDFDMSGMVNARYAKPHESILNRIKSVRSRLFRGMCRKREEWEPIRTRFLEKQNNIRDLYRHFPLLNDFNRKSALRYIDEFYILINDDKKFQRHIVQDCKRGPAPGGAEREKSR